MADVLKTISHILHQPTSKTHGRCIEVYCPPFSLVSDLGEQKFIRPPNLPGLQSLAILKLLVLKLPCQLGASVSTRPLPIDVDVDIDVEVSRHMHGYVRCRDRLSQSRGRSDGGKEGDDHLQRVSTGGMLWGRYMVGQIGGRGVKCCPKVGAKGHIVAAVRIVRQQAIVRSPEKRIDLPAVRDTGKDTETNLRGLPVSGFATVNES